MKAVEDQVTARSLAAAPTYAEMEWIPGGTFCMGSDHHYPEEAPAHEVSVDGFWIDRTSITNRDFFRFVTATGYVTFAELKPDPKDYPGALPDMGFAGLYSAQARCRSARLEPMVAVHPRCLILLS